MDVEDLWMQGKLERREDEMASTEREVRSLRRQLDSTQLELNDLTRVKETLNRDNRRWVAPSSGCFHLSKSSLM